MEHAESDFIVSVIAGCLEAEGDTAIARGNSALAESRYTEAMGLLQRYSNLLSMTRNASKAREVSALLEQIRAERAKKKPKQ
jgi:hypothetical protein